MKEGMTVHFIAPKTNLRDEIGTFQAIVAAIHKRGHALARDWVEPAYLRLTNSSPDAVIDWSAFCRANIESIPQCDMVIAEISTKSFGIGYQVGLAVSQKKPTLLLRREGISKEAFLGGLDHPYVQKKEYTLETIDKIVGAFLDQDEEQSKDIRFNLFIDRKIDNYLKRVSIQEGKTKAEIVRERLWREIEESE